MIKMLFGGLVLITAPPVSAQCFNRFGNCDPGSLEIRSQLSVTVPLADQSSPNDAIKAMEAAQQQMTVLAAKELDAVKAVYGPETTLRQTNISSSMQDAGNRGPSAYVSLNSVYAIKKKTP